MEIEVIREQIHPYFELVTVQPKDFDAVPMFVWNTSDDEFRISYNGEYIKIPRSQIHILTKLIDKLQEELK